MKLEGAPDTPPFDRECPALARLWVLSTTSTAIQQQLGTVLLPYHNLVTACSRTTERYRAPETARCTLHARLHTDDARRGHARSQHAPEVRATKKDGKAGQWANGVSSKPPLSPRDHKVWGTASASDLAPATTTTCRPSLSGAATWSVHHAFHPSPAAYAADSMRLDGVVTGAQSLLCRLLPRDIRL